MFLNGSKKMQQFSSSDRKMDRKTFYKKQSETISVYLKGKKGKHSNK